MELPGKYMVKLLYGWNDGKFEKEYLKRLERNQRRQKKKQKKVEEEEWEREEQVEKVIWGENTEVSPEKKP